MGDLHQVRTCLFAAPQCMFVRSGTIFFFFFRNAHTTCGCPWVRRRFYGYWVLPGSPSNAQGRRVLSCIHQATRVVRGRSTHRSPFRSVLARRALQPTSINPKRARPPFPFPLYYVSTANPPPQTNLPPGRRHSRKRVVEHSIPDAAGAGLPEASETRPQRHQAQQPPHQQPGDCQGIILYGMYINHLYILPPSSCV